jgi:hypothetical protein
VAHLLNAGLQRGLNVTLNREDTVFVLAILMQEKDRMAKRGDQVDRLIDKGVSVLETALEGLCLTEKESQLLDRPPSRRPRRKFHK